MASCHSCIAFCITALMWIACSQAITSTHQPSTVVHVKHHANHATSAIDIPKYGFDLITDQTYFDSSTRQCPSLFIIPPTSITFTKHRSKSAAPSATPTSAPSAAPSQPPFPHVVAHYRLSSPNATPSGSPSPPPIHNTFNPTNAPSSAPVPAPTATPAVPTGSTVRFSPTNPPSYTPSNGPSQPPSAAYLTCPTGRSLNADIQSVQTVMITVERASGVQEFCTSYHYWPVNAVLTLFEFVESNMGSLVMIALSVTTIWVFIKSLMKNKTIELSPTWSTTRLFITSFIDTKACLFVFVALCVCTNCALSISGGYGHTCALQTTSPGFNGVKCWGMDYNGILGYENFEQIGDEPNEMGLFLPYIDIGINNDDIIQLDAGYYHTCVLSKAGNAKCWGSQVNGPEFPPVLGLGNTDNKGDAPYTMGSYLPFIDFGGAWFAIQIVAGNLHTCALLNNGTTPNVIKCWGFGTYGRLGYGDTNSRGGEANEMGDSLPLVDLGTNFDAIQISLGGELTCALSRSNKVKCFGANYSGQLGIGDEVDRGDSAGQMGDTLPFVELGTGFTPIRIEVGHDHVCALSDSGDVKCWGRGGLGALGYENQNNIGDAPNQMGDFLPIVDLGSNLTAVQITAGAHHNCALLTTDEVKCWGYNYAGTLGYGHTNSLGSGPDEMGDSLPFVDLGYEGVSEVNAGYKHTCVTFSTDELKCFGWNYNGQLGYGVWTNNGQLGYGNGPNQMGDFLPFVDLGFLSSNPTLSPTGIPTSQTIIPTSQTSNPSSTPTSPTSIPTHSPSKPSISPTSQTDIPTRQTNNPSITPTDIPTNIPTDIPTYIPSSHPTDVPTRQTSNPSATPTDIPTYIPSGIPTLIPTDIPTDIPTSSPSNPSTSPTNPTNVPTSETSNPSSIPTYIPTGLPTDIPTSSPSRPTTSPTTPTDVPTSQTNNPSSTPSDFPTNVPTSQTSNPSSTPTDIPTKIPTDIPTYSPSKPSTSPTSLTDVPTVHPTVLPTLDPTIDPTPQPTPYANYECDEIPYILVIFFDITTDKEDFEDELVDILITVMTNTIKSLIEMQWNSDWCINLIKQNLIPYGNRRRLLDSVRYRATFNMNKAIKKDVFDNSKFRFNVFKKIFTDNVKERLGSTTLIENEAQFSMDSVSDVEDIAENRTSVKSEPFFDFSDPLMISLMIFIGFALSILISGKIHARCIDSDDFRLEPVFLFTIYVWDFYTDLLFSISLYTTYVSPDTIDFMVLFIASVVFLIGPFLLNFYDLVKFEDVWRSHPILSELYKKWLLQNGQYVYMLSLLSGSTYAVINLVNSNFLGLKVFSMGLSQVDVLKFNQTRLMNVVLLENIPQVIIQICFLVLSKQLTDLSMLAIVSSTLSIFLAVLKHINLQKSMDDKNVSEVMFSFKVFHSAGDNLKGYMHKTYAVSKAIENTLELTRDSVECLPIDTVIDNTHGNGLKLHCVVRTTKKSPAELKNGLVDSSKMTVDFGHLQLRKQIAAKWYISELITVFDPVNFYEGKNQEDMRPDTRTHGESNTHDGESHDVQKNVDIHAESIQMECVA